MLNPRSIAVMGATPQGLAAALKANVYQIDSR